MNLNTGFFAAYHQRRRQATIGYHLPLNNQNGLFSKSVKSATGSESFLPSITKINGSSDGHRPYRRNDFANNHLFVAKHKLTRVFLNQPIVDIQSKSELIHLFDPHQSKEKNRRINKNKRQENNSDSKSNSTLDQDAHLSVVNLIMKPSLPPSEISHRRQPSITSQTKAPRPSLEWINPVLRQNIRSTSTHSLEIDFDPNAIINELMDKNSEIVNSTTNTLDLSLLYVKSILPSAASQQH